MRAFPRSLPHARVRRAAATVLSVTLLATGAGLAVATPAAAQETTPTKQATKLSLTPLRVTVAPNQTTRHTARLMYSDGRPALSAAVQLWTRPPSTQTWTLFKTQPVDGNGYTTFAVAPRSTLYLQARFAGTTTRSSSSSSSALVTVATLGQRAVQEATRHQGKPYQWGAAGPYRFDCSGFTMYVFGRFGKSLPHNSAQQYGTVRRIDKAQAQVGDLIFTFNSSGRVSHVGIYAGGGYMWAAPHSGSYVRKQSIWTRNYAVGRVG